VPRLVIESGRYQPTGRVRIVDYQDPYPIRTTKSITVEELGGDVLDIRPIGRQDNLMPTTGSDSAP